MVDSLGRKIDYMRISITYRCNLRCKYCMPDGIENIPMSDILTFEEICRVVEQAASLGIKNIKITGGEPLVRKGCPDLIGMLKKIDGIEQVTLTTNGVLLEEQLPELLAAGLDAVNISLDVMDRQRFVEITGRDEYDRVISSIKAAYDSGLRTKINTVSLARGKNGTVLSENFKSLIELTRDMSLDVRFIEMMPIGYGRDFPAVSHDRLLRELKDTYAGLEQDISHHGFGPAHYYRIPGYKGSVGLISAIHGKFCNECNRIRMTSQGYIKSCLCFEDGVDLMSYLRAEDSNDEELRHAIEKAILGKPSAHCFENPTEISEDKSMVAIGG